MSGCTYNLKATDPLWSQIHVEYKSTYEWDDDRNVLFLRMPRDQISCQYRPMFGEQDERLKLLYKRNEVWHFQIIQPINGPISPCDRHKMSRLPMNFYFQCLIPELPYNAGDIVFWIWSLGVKGLDKALANMIVCFVIS